MDATDREGATARAYGRLAGVLFVVGSLSSIPSSLLLEPRPASSIYLLTGAAVLSGLLCFAIPWERLPRWVFHLLPALGTVYVAAAAEAASPSYSFYYVFIAVYVAYVFDGAGAITVQLLFIALALIAPAIWDPDTSGETVRRTLLFVPGLGITSAVVVLLRRRLDSDRRRYREFAEEAYDIALRIRRYGRESEGGASPPPGRPRA
jgi:hypothetical protein